MQRFSDRRAEKIIVVCGSQMGKTESLLCVLGHRYDDGPYMPTLWVAPTERMVKTISQDRLDRMLRSTPDLWAKTARGHAYKLQEKWIGGIRLGFAHAGSAAELSMNAAGLILVDERDRMDNDVAGEGDPLVLAAARAKNFANSTVAVTSTPTLEGASPIWSLYEEGTREQWAWPCPHCAELFIPKLALLQWPEGALPAEARQMARVVCPECGGEIEDRHKQRMNAFGRFIPHVVDAEGREQRCAEIPINAQHSFWISGLASPWISFGQMAQELVAAYRSGEQERIQAIVNTYGGEVFKVRGDAPEWETVMERRQDYTPGTVPSGVQLITLGVDVQVDRLYWSLRGWGFNAESWGLGEGVLWGDTAYDAVWIALGQLVQRPIGDKMIHRGFVDSGYRPGKKWQRPENVIYQFCRRHPGQCFPTKGHDTQDTPLRAKLLDMTVGGKLIKGGIKLWHLNTDYLKSALYARVRAPAGEPGGWHCHRDITEEYARQCVSEQVLVKASGKRVWIQSGANHFLDVEVLNLAAALSLNVYQLKPSAPQAEPAKPKAPPRRGFARRSL